MDTARRTAAEPGSSRVTLRPSASAHGERHTIPPDAHMSAGPRASPVSAARDSFEVTVQLPAEAVQLLPEAQSEPLHSLMTTLLFSGAGVFVTLHYALPARPVACLVGGVICVLAGACYFGAFLFSRSTRRRWLAALRVLRLRHRKQ